MADQIPTANASLMQQELERQEARRGNEIFQDVTVRNVLDIKRLLHELDPSRKVADDSIVSAEITMTDKDGKRRTVVQSAKVGTQSKRDVLLSGFSILKRHQQCQNMVGGSAPVIVNGRPMKAPSITSIGSYSWVDPLLKRWLGARRDGLHICWEVEGYIYKYDIFEHKLTRTAQ